jgi:hypothetical protein
VVNRRFSIRSTEAGVPGEFIRIVIGTGAVISRSRAIVRRDQPVKVIIAIAPAVGRASVEPKGL